MHQPEDSMLDECCTLLTLDDACLAAVLGGLNAQQLRATAAVSKRLAAISQANSLWLKHVRDDFGLFVATVKGVQQVPGSAAKLYDRLQRAKQQPYMLPAQAVCTDGGCDEPYDAYWAGNMFSSKRSLLFCSAANTRNISVLARLCPSAISGSGSSAHQAQQQQQQQQQQQEEQRREFLLRRCSRAARPLISQSMVDTYVVQHRAQQEAANSCTNMLMRLVQRWSSYEVKAPAALAALQTCSTEGLAAFFVHAYMGQQQPGQDWAQAMFQGLSDAEIHHVHEVAFQLWSELMDSPTRHRFLLLPMPLQPVLLRSTTAQPAGAAATRAAEVAASGAAVQQQQQEQQRRLLCAEDQLEALCSRTTPGEGTCIVQQCILARDGLGGGSTCPVRSGFIFLGHYQATKPSCATTLAHHATSSSSSSSSSRSILSAPPQPAGEDAARAAAAGEAAAADVAAVAADVGSLAFQPWVTAAHNLTTAGAVHAASRAGLLPPVTCYVTAGSAEYTEFAAPSQQQLAQQRQEWSALGASSSSSSSGGEGAGGWPAGGWVAPVLWFRFADAPRGNGDDEDEDDADDDADDDDGDDPDEAGVAGAAAAAEMVAGPDQGEEQQGEPHLDGHSSGSSSSGEESGAAAEVGTIFTNEGSQGADVSQQLQHQGAAAAGCAPHAAAAAAEGHQAVQGNAAGADGALAAAAAAPFATPSSGMLCDAAPDLPVAATEVAAALGWLPTGQHAGMLAVQLQQARSANLVCALLLDCEDVKPAFNQSRGGCNIDMQLVMLRGHAVGELPQGLEVVPAGQGNGDDAMARNTP